VEAEVPNTLEEHMTRHALALLLVLAAPAAALADGPRDRDRDLQPPPRPVVGARHQQPVVRLLARYRSAAASRWRRQELPPLEARILRAFDEEVAEARAALDAARWDDDGPWRRRGSQERQLGRARLEQLASLRAEFGRLCGATGRGAVERKLALVEALARLEAQESGGHRWPAAVAGGGGR
jgi:hypothetical protein